MIITLNMDTEKDRETCKKVLELVLGFGGSVDLEVVGAPRAVKNVYEAARRMNAGEQVIFHAEPKKRRGRPPKNKDIYQVARERIAERSK